MIAQTVESVRDLIGNTPMVRLQPLPPEGAAAVWAKIEKFNPAGSVKDRIATSMVEAAEDSGALTPGDVIVEPTSGNTGIGLAMTAAVKGYRLILTMPERVSAEPAGLMKAYGAEVVLTPGEPSSRTAISWSSSSGIRRTQRFTAVPPPRRS